MSPNASGPRAAQMSRSAFNPVFLCRISLTTSVRATLTRSAAIAGKAAPCEPMLRITANPSISRAIRSLLDFVGELIEDGNRVTPLVSERGRRARLSQRLGDPGRLWDRRVEHF